MSAYLYTWNPRRWTWVDQGDAIYRVNNGDHYDMYWSCGNTKKILIGDIFFLMRLGEQPKGIIGCGYISSLPYPLPHWDEKKAAEGKTALRTDLSFKALSDQPIIALAVLLQRYPAYKWTPEAGGLSVPESIAVDLFAEVQQSTRFGFTPESSAEVRLYAEGKVRIITSTTYDRSALARQACIDHYGYDCAVCGFNFSVAYGDMGAKYIEVHHRQQIADIGEEYLIDPVKDLRPVCANCHRMLHRRRPALSIAELLTQKTSLQRKAMASTRLKR
jgi:5-methylcytosine-specific restriction enzyme A